MERKIIFLSYPILSDLIKSVLKEMKSPYPIEIKETEVGYSSGIAEQMDMDDSIAAVVTVRGHAIHMPPLKKTPVIVTKVSGDDFLYAIEKAAKSTDRVVVMRVGKIFDEFQLFDHLFKVKIFHDTYQNTDEARKKMEYWMNQGINTFVGTSIVANVAEKLKVNFVFIYSKKSIQESIEQAIHIVKTLESENTKYEKVNTIIQNSSNAVIATDSEGKIEFINEPAVKLLDFHQDELVGKNVIDVLPNIPIERVFKAKRVFENFIVPMDSGHLIANITPILVRSRVLGSIITFQEISKVNDADTKIRKELAKKGLIAKYRFTDIIFQSDVMKKTIERAKLFAKTDATILIEGKTGTGKELLAQSIHNYSNRNQQTFVAINCSALPENLLESELFGYDEGAFTGAKKGGKAGLFELAHKGTIFLDEIGEITPKLQSRLLRVLQEKEIMRVGGDSVIPVDVRIIAATNKDLGKLVENGVFREDLYYRLNTLFLQVPSLQMRREDIPLLIQHFLSIKGLNKSDQELIKNQLIKELTNYPWKGNIRELENIIERIIVIYQYTHEIRRVKEILDELLNRTVSVVADDHINLNMKIKESEINYIKKILDEVGGNRELASRKLGISRTTLWRKLNGKD